MPMSLNGRVLLSIAVDPELRQRVKVRTAQLGLTMSAYLKRVIDAEIDAHIEFEQETTALLARHKVEVADFNARYAKARTKKQFAKLEAERVALEETGHAGRWPERRPKR